MIKKVLIALLAITFLAGCATNSEYYAAVSESNAKRAEIEKSGLKLRQHAFRASLSWPSLVQKQIVPQRQSPLL
jgi:uncharacterized lipoprotein YajG